MIISVVADRQRLGAEWRTPLEVLRSLAARDSPTPVT